MKRLLSLDGQQYCIYSLLQSNNANTHHQVAGRTAKLALFICVCVEVGGEECELRLCSLRTDRILYARYTYHRRRFL